MAAEACRLKIGTGYDMAIMKSKDPRSHFNAYIRI